MLIASLHACDAVSLHGYGGEGAWGGPGGIAGDWCDAGGACGASKIWSQTVLAKCVVMSGRLLELNE